jgi:hypothetical protein
MLGHVSLALLVAQGYAIVDIFLAGEGERPDIRAALAHGELILSDGSMGAMLDRAACRRAH